MKIIDFGKLGKIDVHKSNFTFDVYSQLVKTATWDSYKELTVKTQQEFAKSLIELEEKAKFKKMVDDSLQELEKEEIKYNDYTVDFEKTHVVDFKKKKK